MPQNMLGPREVFSGPSGVALGGWLTSSFLAIIVPLSIWSKERNTYYNYYGKYIEYEQQQRQYEEEANGNYDNYSYGNNCSWWNYSCRKRWYNYQQYQQNNNGDNNNDNNSMYLPNWYKFLGGKMNGDDDKEGEEMGNEASGSQKFVYAWTLIMFIGLVLYGARSLYKGGERTGLIVSLFLFGNFCLLNLVTVAQGAIETEDRQMENSVYGWYGQWGVLIAYTDFWVILHSFIFASFFGIQSWIEQKAAADVDAEERAVEITPTDSVHTNYLDMA